MELNKKRRHTLMCYILVLYFEACNAWNIVIKSWLQSKTSTLWSKDRNKCSCVMWWFLNMACPNEVCFVSKDQKVFITMQDKEMKIQEWIMEFIVDVQSLAQHGKGKWWRNQPRWLVRGTKQALVKRQLTMCASAKVKC